ncbi:ABC transporter permease [Aeromicrobium sp. CF3.5]|uniref:ABC transporter permease n=1 Tax=Aeromicrobium sp. CF3.5 TaxID=3373078 RepID=UPI003EE7FDA0
MSIASDIDLSQFDTPGRGRGLLDVFSRGYLLRLLVRQGTATRYRNSVLGWTWSYLKPATQFLVYYFVLGLVLQMQRNVENYPIYLFTAIIVINLFSEGFGNATTAITENSALVRKIYMPRELFPVAAIIVSLIHFVPQAIILLLACALVGWTPSLLGTGIFLAGVLMIAVFSLGLGMMFGAVNVRFRDAQNFVDIIKMVAFWSAPAVYTWQMVAVALPDWAFRIYFSNPLVIGVEMFHVAMWDPTTDVGTQWPTYAGVHIAIACFISVASLVIGQAMFRRFERTFAQDL